MVFIRVISESIPSSP